jgi:hypothetical protein
LPLPEIRLPFIEEIPPLMVLAEASASRLIFRFRNRVWGLATLAGGLTLVGTTAWFQVSHSLQSWQFAIIYLFGLVLLYSSVYSFTADQFLTVDGRDGVVHFHKSNLYGRVDWERPGNQFKEIRVSRARTIQGPGVARNWVITLIGGDGLQLFLGENEFGSMSRDGAKALADNVGRLAGIKVNEDSV